MSKASRVRVGDPAPDFTLSSTTGEPVTLSSFRNRAEVILFFYPRDSSLVCTAEACAFRDTYEVFQNAGAEVIGISGDSTRSHRGFSQRHHLPYVLLSDPEGAVRALFGVPKTLGLVPGRVTYVIDKQGVVRLVFSSQFQPAKHVAEALDVLLALRAQSHPTNAPP